MDMNLILTAVYYLSAYVFKFLTFAQSWSGIVCAWHTVSSCWLMFNKDCHYLYLLRHWT